MRLARDIENALARYLDTEGTAAAGGLHRFNTQSGDGVMLGIRTGHDERGALPDQGFILCECLESDVQQVIPKTNFFHVRVTVALVYPLDDNSDDPGMLASFDALAGELEHALVDDEIHTLLTAQGEGVVVHGLTDGITFSTSINGAQREASWSFPFAVSGAQKIL